MHDQFVENPEKIIVLLLSLLLLFMQVSSYKTMLWVKIDKNYVSRANIWAIIRASMRVYEPNIKKAKCQQVYCKCRLVIKSRRCNLQSYVTHIIYEHTNNIRMTFRFSYYITTIDKKFRFHEFQWKNALNFEFDII